MTTPDEGHYRYEFAAFEYEGYVDIYKPPHKLAAAQQEWVHGYFYNIDEFRYCTRSPLHPFPVHHTWRRHMSEVSFYLAVLLHGQNGTFVTTALDLSLYKDIIIAFCVMVDHRAKLWPPTT